MIKTEFLKDGKLIRHYSDDPAMALLQEDTGIVYSEAVDINPTFHTYKEVSNPNPLPDKTTEEQLAEAREEIRMLKMKAGEQ